MADCFLLEVGARDNYGDNIQWIFGPMPFTPAY